METGQRTENHSLESLLFKKVCKPHSCKRLFLAWLFIFKKKKKQPTIILVQTESFLFFVAMSKWLTLIDINSMHDMIIFYKITLFFLFIICSDYKYE